MFNTYVKDGRTIRATALAYETIYKQQGYRPAEQARWVISDLGFGIRAVPTFTAGDDFGQGLGDSTDNSAGLKPKTKSKRK